MLNNFFAGEGTKWGVCLIRDSKLFYPDAEIQFARAGTGIAGLVVLSRDRVPELIDLNLQDQADVRGLRGLSEAPASVGTASRPLSCAGCRLTAGRRQLGENS